MVEKPVRAGTACADSGELFLWVFDRKRQRCLNAIERLFIPRISDRKPVLPQANMRSACGIWTAPSSSRGELRPAQCQELDRLTMAVIFNAICESQSDLLLDPYLNSIGGAPAGSEKGGENQCF
ncbi:MAG: hypothetical protein ACLRJV_22665 [Eubacteriales bacterium]